MKFKTPLNITLGIGTEILYALSVILVALLISLALSSLVR